MLNSLRVFNKLRAFPKIQYFSSCAQPNDLGFKTSYNHDQTSKILNVINTSSQLDLKNYQISNQRIQRIIKRRQTKGNFESIEDILEVDGFGIKILEKFCSSIINTKPASEENAVENLSSTIAKDQIESAKRQQFITPAMLEVIRSKVKTVVSFHVDLNYFSWTKFYYERAAKASLDEPKFFVENWNCQEFAKQDKNLRLTDLIELLVKINDHIPQADVYVMESLPPAIQAKQPGSALQVNVNIQKAQLIAMLSALMASRRSINKLFAETNELNLIDGETKEFSYIDSVYFLRNFLPSRFYKILIGNERVSAANVINQIIQYNYSIHDKSDPTHANVDISEEHRLFWKNANRIHQEYLGSSMLVGLTFLKLCIERCSGSLESLNSRVKKH